MEQPIENRPIKINRFNRQSIFIDYKRLKTSQIFTIKNRWSKKRYFDDHSVI
jgi:hypothetical protein